MNHVQSVTKWISRKMDIYKIAEITKSPLVTLWIRTASHTELTDPCIVADTLQSAKAHTDTVPVDSRHV